MTAPPDVKELVLQWVEKAEHDLRNAQHTLTLTEDCPFDTICFHAQQCVEKYIKALLTFFHIAAARTHDLTNLAQSLPAEILKKILIEDLAQLTPYAVESRYPAGWEMHTREEAQDALAAALKIREVCRSTLREAGIVE
jgi:HEPN domain-containing protein